MTTLLFLMIWQGIKALLLATLGMTALILFLSLLCWLVARIG